MNKKEITITSKNQITIPADYVRQLGLSKSRVLKAHLQKNQIILTSEPSLSIQMQKFWGKHKAAKPLSNKALKQAIRETASKRAR